MDEAAPTYSKTIRYIELTLSNLRGMLSKTYSVIECASCLRGMQRTSKILHSLTDQQLKDIGMRREEIDKKLRGICYKKE